jgi:hypothetical protein
MAGDLTRVRLAAMRAHVEVTTKSAVAVEREELLSLIAMAERSVSEETLLALFGAALEQGRPCVVGNMGGGAKAERLLARDLGPAAESLARKERG